MGTCRGAPGDKFDKKSWFHNKGSKIGHVTEVDKEDLFLESTIGHFTLDNFFHCRGDGVNAITAQSRNVSEKSRVVFSVLFHNSYIDVCSDNSIQLSGEINSLMIWPGSLAHFKAEPCAKNVVLLFVLKISIATKLHISSFLAPMVLIRDVPVY